MKTHHVKTYTNDEYFGHLFIIEVAIQLLLLVYVQAQSEEGKAQEIICPGRHLRWILRAAPPDSYPTAQQVLQSE